MREQIWRPISWLPIVVDSNKEMIQADFEQKESIEKALERPGCLDDATVHRLTNFCAERQEILLASRRQLAKWDEECANDSDRSLLINAFEQQRELENNCLAITSITTSLKSQTIEAIMAMSDEELLGKTELWKEKSPSTSADPRDTMRSFVEESISPVMEDLLDHCRPLKMEETLLVVFKATSVMLGKLAGQDPDLTASLNALEGAAQKLAARVFETTDRATLRCKIESIIEPRTAGFSDIFSAHEMDNVIDSAATLMHTSLVLAFDVKDKHPFLEDLIEKHLVPLASDLVASAVMGA